MKKSDFLPNGIISQEEQLEKEYPVYFEKTGLLGKWKSMKLKDVDPKKYRSWANGIFTLK